MDLFIKVENTKTKIIRYITVPSNSTIAHLKHKIREKLNITVTNFNIYLNEFKPLNHPHATLIDYNIRPHSIISIKCLGQHPQQSQKLTFKETWSKIKKHEHYKRLMESRIDSDENEIWFDTSHPSFLAVTLMQLIKNNKVSDPRQI